MNHYLNILAICCGAIIWVKALPILYYIKATRAVLDGSNKIKRLKPLDCESCLTFWGTSIYMVATSHPTTEALAMGLIAYMFTALLTKLI